MNELNLEGLCFLKAAWFLKILHAYLYFASFCQPTHDLQVVVVDNLLALKKPLSSVLVL